MTAMLAAIALIAAGLVPLIQRDLRLAHARIEARRRRRAMHPLVRELAARAFHAAEAFGDRTRR